MTAVYSTTNGNHVALPAAHGAHYMRTPPDTFTSHRVLCDLGGIVMQGSRPSQMTIILHQQLRVRLYRGSTAAGFVQFGRKSRVNLHEDLQCILKCT